MITPSFSITGTERVLPKLALDFTTAVLDSRVTFTRSGNTATVVNSSGFVAPINADLPRFDYDPVTLACKGLLVEESRANTFLYSEDFSNAAYTSSSTVATNTQTAPDGTLTADTIAELPATTNFYIGQTISFTSGTTHTVSVFLKKGNGATSPDIVQLTFPGAAFGASQYANYNIVLGTVLTKVGSVTATITPINNGWMRLTYTATATATASGLAACCVFTNNSDSLGRVPVYAGAATSQVFIWGAQLETGAFATSYIPTEATALTRNADVATMTGTNFSDWFNASEGTLYAEGVRFGTANTFPRMWQFDDGAESNYIYAGLVTSGSAGYGAVAVSGTEVTSLSTVAVGANTVGKVVLAYKADNFGLSVNGSATQTDTSGAIPTVDQAIIGFRRAGANNYMNGHIRKLLYWNQRLTNNEIRAFAK